MPALVSPHASTVNRLIQEGWELTSAILSQREGPDSDVP